MLFVMFHPVSGVVAFPIAKIPFCIFVKLLLLIVIVLFGDSAAVPKAIPLTRTPPTVVVELPPTKLIFFTLLLNDPFETLAEAIQTTTPVAFVFSIIKSLELEPLLEPSIVT